MGMYDELFIDKKFLPKSLQNHEDGWQTKSLWSMMEYITIDNEGKVYQSGQLSDHTGEIRFYQGIKNIWYEFVALVYHGTVIKLIQVS
jgi:hypothetical protein